MIEATFLKFCAKPKALIGCKVVSSIFSLLLERFSSFDYRIIDYQLITGRKSFQAKQIFRRKTLQGKNFPGQELSGGESEQEFSG
jgi:hypothetical protein